MTPLHDASWRGHHNVQVLIQNGADVNAKDNIHQWTPIYLAALNGYKNIVEQHVRNGCDINAKDRDGDTPLIYATKECHKKVA